MRHPGGFTHEEELFCTYRILTCYKDNSDLFIVALEFQDLRGPVALKEQQIWPSYIYNCFCFISFSKEQMQKVIIQDTVHLLSIVVQR